MSGKVKEVGKYVLCLQKVRSKAITKGIAPDYSKCEDKLAAKWAKLESKYHPECPTSWDEESLQVASDMFAGEAGLLLGGAPSCLGDGVGVGGHCWFLGEQGESCDSVCVSRGLVDSDGTRDFAGSDALLDRSCGFVLSALGVPYQPVMVSDAADFGCSVCPVAASCGSFARRRYTAATASMASSPLIRRACACEAP
jgi:hypothetical protein